MNLMAGIGSEGILQKYKARFRPEKSGDGYRFFHDNYGDGVACSCDQYNHYVSEFEEFMTRSQRFMFFWTIGYFMLVAVAMVVTVWQFDFDAFDRYEKVWDVGVMTVFLSPLAWFFWKGYQLIQRPYEELVNINPAATRTMSTGKRHTASEMLDRRLLGLSPGFVRLVPVGALIGIGSLAYEYYSRGKFDPLLLLLFVLLIACFLWIGWRIRTIQAADEKTLQEQSGLQAQSQKIARHRKR